MRVSIITATYNSEASILSALRSIESQNYLNIELIIVDGASKDNTLELIRSNYKRELKVISERDKGIYDALNKGIRHATGDIIGFVHSDDLLAHPEVLAEMVETFKTSDPDGVYGDLEYVDKEDPAKVIRYWKSQSFKSKLLKRGWMPAHPTLFLKKEVYKKHGFFDLDYKIAADYDLMLRIFQDTSLEFKYFPRVVTKMRIGGASNRSLKNILQKSKEDYLALRSNNISYPVKTLVFKNLSKIPQFLNK